MKSQSDSVDLMFDELRKLLGDQQARISGMEKFEAHINENPDLFDEDDMKKLQGTMAARRSEHNQLIQDFQSAIELYNKTVVDLEEKITKRQHLLEHIDSTLGAVSSEPELLEYFGVKQAMFAKTVIEAKKRLCSKIRDKLTTSLPGK